MSSGPTLLRLICGDEAADGARPLPGDSGYAEYVALRDTWQAVVSMPRPSPRAESIDAVVREAALHAVTWSALDATKRPSPDTSAVEAVQAEAAAQSAAIAALGSLAPVSPSASALEAVRARAAEMTEAAESIHLATARAAFLSQEGASVDDAEVARLQETWSVVSGVPHPTPSADAVRSVRSEAAAHTAMTTALREVPRSSPDRESIDRVIAEAARQSAAHRATSSPRGSASRTENDAVPVVLWSRFRSVSISAWISAVALVAVTLAAAVLLVPAGEQEPVGEEVARLDGASVPGTPIGGAGIEEQETASGEVVAPDEVTVSDESVPGTEASPSPPVASQSLSSRSGLDQPAARQEGAEASGAEASVPDRKAVGDEPQKQTLSAEPSSRSGFREAATWNAPDDVRLLSLRLRQLREQNEGLTWDEPAAPLGAPSAVGVSQMTPGVQAVREESSPVRVRVRMRTTTDH